MFFERRGVAVNRPVLLGIDRSVGKINRLADHVQDAAKRAGANGHLNRTPEIGRFHAALHTVGRLHRHRAHAILTKVLFDLGNHVENRVASLAIGDHLKGVVDFRKMSGFEFDVNDRSDDLDDSSNVCHVFSYPRSRLG